MSSDKALIAHPEEVRMQAKALYLMHTPMNDISSQLHVSTSTLSQWRTRDKWAELREREDESLAADMVSSRKLSITRINRGGMAQIERALQFITERPDPPSISEAVKIGELIGILDRVHRLDSGKATDQIAIKTQSSSMPVERIREILVSKDEFMQPPVTVDEGQP